MEDLLEGLYRSKPGELPRSCFLAVGFPAVLLSKALSKVEARPVFVSKGSAVLGKADDNSDWDAGVLSCLELLTEAI